MKYGIQPVKYIRINLSRKEFDQIFTKKTYVYIIEINDESEEKLKQPNQFIRFIYNEWYMDITISRVKQKEKFVIYLGDIIDYNKPRL